MIVERINLMCSLLNKSQAQIAKELGISRQTLNHIIRGNRKVDELTRQAILKYFNLPEDVFYKEIIYLTLKDNNLNIREGHSQFDENDMKKCWVAALNRGIKVASILLNKPINETYPDFNTWFNDYKSK